MTTWIGRLRCGDESAAQRLWERYFDRLVHFARGKLVGLPRRVADEEDVALSAFQSFFQAAAENRFPRLGSRDDLWQLLIVMTARKAIDQRRYEGRAKRQGTVPAVAGRRADDSAQDYQQALEELISDEPTPSFAAHVAEELHVLLDRLGDDALRAVAVRKLEGYTNAEISQQLSCSPRTVKRRLWTIRKIWGEFVGE